MKLNYKENNQLCHLSSKHTTVIDDVENLQQRFCGINESVYLPSCEPNQIGPEIFLVRVYSNFSNKNLVTIILDTLSFKHFKRDIVSKKIC